MLQKGQTWRIETYSARDAFFLYLSLYERAVAVAVACGQTKVEVNFLAFVLSSVGRSRSLPA